MNVFWKRLYETLEITKIMKHPNYSCKKIEKLISEMLNPRSGVPIGTHKAFLKDIPYAFTGYDLIEWLLEKFDIEDTEALHLANSICKLGYIFPVNDMKNLTVKDDSTLYRFQTSFFWLSHNLNNEDTDYAIYLVKRNLDNSKDNVPLEPYEEENLEKIQIKLGDKWEFVCLQAEQQNKLSKERRKTDKIVLDSQERAFWRIHRPPPNTFDPLETTPILNAQPNRNRKKTVDNLSLEIMELKQSFTRCRWKTSDVIQSYINRWENYYEFDPFIVKMEPSNPWISDDNAMWCQNPNILTTKRLRLWSLNFKELLKDEQGFHLFLDFLKKEYSSENIRFWQACQDFKKCPNPKKPEAMTKIYKEYLAPNAPKEINIDSYSRELVNKGVRDGSRYALDLAQDHIYTLMKKDSYVRFLRSEMYKNLVATSQSSNKKKMILGFNLGQFLHHSTYNTPNSAQMAAAEKLSNLEQIYQTKYDNSKRKSGLEDLPINKGEIFDAQYHPIQHSSSAGDLQGSSATLNSSNATNKSLKNIQNNLKNLTIDNSNVYPTIGQINISPVVPHHIIYAGGAINAIATSPGIKVKEESEMGQKDLKERPKKHTRHHKTSIVASRDIPKPLNNSATNNNYDNENKPKENTKDNLGTVIRQGTIDKNERAEKIGDKEQKDNNNSKHHRRLESSPVKHIHHKPKEWEDENADGLVMKLPLSVLEKELSSPSFRSKNKFNEINKAKKDLDQISQQELEKCNQAQPNSKTPSAIKEDKDKILRNRDEIIEITLKSPKSSQDSRKNISKNMSLSSNNKGAIKNKVLNKSTKEILPNENDICPWEDEEEVVKILKAQKESRELSNIKNLSKEMMEEVCPWEDEEEVERILTIDKKKVEKSVINLKASPLLIRKEDGNSKETVSSPSKTFANRIKSPRNSLNEVCPWEDQGEIIQAMSQDAKDVGIEVIHLSKLQENSNNNDEICPWDNEEEIECFEKHKIVPQIPVEVIEIKNKHVSPPQFANVKDTLKASDSTKIIRKKTSISNKKK
ncbi:uncharacterized protein LOC135925833 isoform X2 [Gordionus sp. m RMFG-2023]|uniref:uncharacterized protein LOC135925833 isoform X2 n=1 Tax=Gordionus sp. m RMFG-2023 TaxID=3053472 RepID=UPI0031FDF50D